jgi:hypothetical protein
MSCWTGALSWGKSSGGAEQAESTLEESVTDWNRLAGLPQKRLLHPPLA